MNPYLFPALSLSPVVFERLMGQIDTSRLDTPTPPGRFTPRQVIAHLADWEPILLGRLKQAVTNPGSTVAAYDEGERATEKGYGGMDVGEQLKVFAAARKDTVSYLESLSEDDMKKTAIHPERGPFSAQDLAFMIIGHDMYHVEQLTQAM